VGYEVTKSQIWSFLAYLNTQKYPQKGLTYYSITSKTLIMHLYPFPVSLIVLVFFIYCYVALRDQLIKALAFKYGDFWFSMLIWFYLFWGLACLVASFV
jgi:hypothetical protein